MPLSIAFLVISCVLDVPYMPYLGLPVFTFASLRPHRMWPTLERKMKATSEASIYNAFLAQAMEEIKVMLVSCNTELEVGQYFLIRICKSVQI